MTASEQLSRLDELATRNASLIRDVEALGKVAVKHPQLSRLLALVKTKAEEAGHRLADAMAEASK